jgi:hypothetical protein
MFLRNFASARVLARQLRRFVDEKRSGREFLAAKMV